MKKIKYFIGFTIGVLFVYVIGIFVSWDADPGNWGGFWRLMCLFFALGWGHTFGLFAKDRIGKR